jgi:hypothetical protein
MKKEYTKEQLWKLYENLPKELRETIFSNETADFVKSICERYDIKKDEEVSKVAELIGDVLLGISTIDNLQKNIEEELKIKKDIADKMSQEFYRSIFYPVKAAIDQIGKTGSPPADSLTEKISTPLKEENIPSAPKKDDSYRESIE